MLYAPSTPSKPLVMSMGEPAGIGPEIAMKAWLERKAQELPPFVLIGCPHTLSAHAEAIGADIPMKEIDSHSLSDGAAVFSEALPILTRSVKTAAVTPGDLTAEGAQLAINAIDEGVALTMKGQAKALVTCPIHKANLLAIGFEHPGHTEYLSVCTKRHGAPASTPIMMLATEDFRIVPVTVHMALRDVPSALTADLIIEAARTTASDLKTRFGIAQPRLAIAALNPHAGENGHMGTEDDTVIKPAIAALTAQGFAVTGPHPADTMFHARARQDYDAALAMYHDQALIPIKTIAFDEAVNVTLGLPFVRTSPDHGTGLDIAGKGIARPDSLIASIKMADQLAASAAAA